MAMNSFKTPGFSPAELASLSLWRVPDVPPLSESVNLTDAQTASALSMPVLTVDEIEAMQKQAYDEAFAQGRQDGYSAGFNEGAKQGYEENVYALQKQATVFTSLMESLSQPFKALDAKVEQELVELAMAIAKQVIRREIKLDPGQVIAAVREAIKVLPLSSQKINLYLHPKDAELVCSVLSLDKLSPAWKIVEDPLITRGGCKVDTEVSHIDASLENRLAAVIATLFGGERQHDDTQVGGAMQETNTRDNNS